MMKVILFMLACSIDKLWHYYEWFNAMVFSNKQINNPRVDSNYTSIHTIAQFDGSNLEVHIECYQILICFMVDLLFESAKCKCLLQGHLYAQV